jgi:hypothetical protein
VWAIIAALTIALVAFVKRDVELRRAEEDRLELQRQIDQAKREKTALSQRPWQHLDARASIR